MEHLSWLFGHGTIFAKAKPENSTIGRAVAEGDFDCGAPVEAVWKAGGGDAVGVEAAEELEVFCEAG